MKSRSKAVLEEYDQIHLIKTYLYANPDNSITVRNAMAAEVELKINDDGRVVARIGEGSDFSDYEEMMDHDAWRGVIEQLRDQVPELETAEFKDRLEEILLQARLLLSINSPGVKQAFRSA